MKVFIFMCAFWRSCGAEDINLNVRQAIPFHRMGQVYVNQATLRVRLKFDLLPFATFCDSLAGMDRESFVHQIERQINMHQVTMSDIIHKPEHGVMDDNRVRVLETDVHWQSLEESCLQVRSWPTDFGLYSAPRHARNPVALGALLGFGLTMAASFVVEAIAGVTISILSLS